MDGGKESGASQGKPCDCHNLEPESERAAAFAAARAPNLFEGSERIRYEGSVLERGIGVVFDTEPRADRNAIRCQARGEIAFDAIIDNPVIAAIRINPDPGNQGFERMGIDPKVVSLVGPHHRMDRADAAGKT